MFKIKNEKKQISIIIFKVLLMVIIIRINKPNNRLIKIKKFNSSMKINNWKLMKINKHLKTYVDKMIKIATIKYQTNHKYPIK